jgi:lysozyme family protein
MADFGISLQYVLRREGGWSDDPEDPGGPTMCGITMATARRHGIRYKEDLKAMTIKKASAIYRADYWRFDGILDQRVATKLFDMAVNMGLTTAVRYLQKALNVYGAELRADGQFGAHTCEAVNRRDPALLLDLLCGISIEH